MYPFPHGWALRLVVCMFLAGVNDAAMKVGVQISLQASESQ